MRRLGLDVGDRTVGISLSDPLGITAQGITTLERVGIRKDTSKILQMIEENDVGEVVVGLPLSMNGSESEQTKKVREFAAMLTNKLVSTGHKDVKVVWQDERLTTVQAEKILIEGDVRRKDRKKVIDKQAAVLILQTYLDSHPGL